MSHAYPGTTKRVFLRDLTHVSAGAVTSGATGTLTVEAPDGTDLVTSSSLVQSGATDDWYWDVTIPADADPGGYRVLATVTAQGATEKFAGSLLVYRHA